MKKGNVLFLCTRQKTYTHLLGMTKISYPLVPIKEYIAFQYIKMNIIEYTDSILKCIDCRIENI